MPGLKQIASDKSLSCPSYVLNIDMHLIMCIWLVQKIELIDLKNSRNGQV